MLYGRNMQNAEFFRNKLIEYPEKKCLWHVIYFYPFILPYRFFRVIPAETYLEQFASDRRHMKRPDFSWIKPPPTYPAIQSMSKYYKLRHNM